MKLRIFTHQAMVMTVTASLIIPQGAFAQAESPTAASATAAAQPKIPTVAAANAARPGLIYAALLPSILATTNSSNSDTGLFPLPPIDNNLSPGGGNGLPAPRPPAGTAPGNPSTGAPSISPSSGSAPPAIVPIGGTTPPPVNPVNPVPVGPTAGNMNVAAVPTVYSCPLFDAEPNADLMNALSMLQMQVQAVQNCNSDSAIQTIQNSNKTIQTSIASLQSQMDSTNPNQVDPTAINTSITAAVNAVGTLGTVISSNAFINSNCGLKTMSKGQVLLALNNIISSLAPYALFAVSASPALAPALPFVIGGSIATSGISAIAKMMTQMGSQLKMDDANNRKALLVNTCEFIRVSKKVEFLQLAQSGKIQQVDQELEKDVTLYSAKFSHPSADLTSRLNYKNSSVKYYSAIQTQAADDQKTMRDLSTALSQNTDDLWACTNGQQYVNIAQTSYVQNNIVFPATVFTNLDKAVNQNDANQKMSATTLKTMNDLSMKRITAFYNKVAAGDDTAVKDCATASRSWFTTIAQAIALTNSDVNYNQGLIEKTLGTSPEYTEYSARAQSITAQKNNISRIEKVMQELSKDNSVIDRSEMDQRIQALKDGLFGVHSWMYDPAPPVRQWIEYTKKMHDQALANFAGHIKDLQNNAFSMTPTAEGKTIMYSFDGVILDPVAKLQDTRSANNLSSINLKTLPVGSRMHDIACQSLTQTWENWVQSMDHLGAIQFFCEMIDGVLDSARMDSTLVQECRGVKDYSGLTRYQSMVDAEKTLMATKGYVNDANMVSAKMKELLCPLPSPNVMTN